MSKESALEMLRDISKNWTDSEKVKFYKSYEVHCDYGREAANEVNALFWEKCRNPLAPEFDEEAFFKDLDLILKKYPQEIASAVFRNRF